jgi:hypothetical protein
MHVFFIVVFGRHPIADDAKVYLYPAAKRFPLTLVNLPASADWTAIAGELKIDVLSLRCRAALPLPAEHSPRLAAGNVQFRPLIGWQVP